MNKKERRNAGIAIIAVVIIIIIFAANPEIEDIDPTKINVNGIVKTVSLETEPVRIDFIEKTSRERLTAQLNENDEYSIHLVPGIYDIELSYTVGGIVSPIFGNCGTYDIDSDQTLNLEC